MKVMLRPLSSFLGFADLKTGALLALFFALLNKVAGVYGLVAALTGAIADAGQLSLYVYSAGALALLLLALRAVTDEDAKRTLYFAHAFAADHVLSTAWTVAFAVRWWAYTPHDGVHEANSPAQEALARTAPPVKGTPLTPAESAAQANAIWARERGPAAALLVAGWLAKVYLALVIYSYALHLRRGSYRALPCSRPAGPVVYAALATEAALGLADGDDDDDDDDAPGAHAITLPPRAPRPPHAPRPTHAWPLGIAATPVRAHGLAAQLERGLRGEDLVFDADDEPR